MSVLSHDLELIPAPRLREPWVWAGVFAGASVLACLAVAVAPLAAYVWLIALFGLPHVVSEMRYCDERFSGRSSRTALAAIFGLLAALATVRLMGTYGAIDGRLGGQVELVLGAALALAAALFMRRWKLLGLAVAALVTYGALAWPIPTFLIWAWLHNLTPLAFLAEAFEGRTRRLVILALSVPFFLVPALVAMGGLVWVTENLFAYDSAMAPSAFDAGWKPLAAFLPARMDLDLAIPLFQAAVVAQVMHYVAVIGLLPRLLAKGAARPGRLAPWPRWWVFYGMLAAMGLGSLAVYMVDFGEARSAYALAATLHSWIELPVFLMALGGGFTSPTAATARD